MADNRFHVICCIVQDDTQSQSVCWQWHYRLEETHLSRRDWYNNQCLSCQKPDSLAGEHITEVSVGAIAHGFQTAWSLRTCVSWWNSPWLHRESRHWFVKVSNMAEQWESDIRSISTGRMAISMLLWWFCTLVSMVILCVNCALLILQ